MLKSYRRVYKFFIDGEYVWADQSQPFIINDDKHQSFARITGNTFQSLWDAMFEWGLVIPGNCWNRAFWSNKRRIEFFVSAVPTWVENCKVREWKLTWEDVEVKPTMKELSRMEAEKVFAYLKQFEQAKESLLIFIKK